MTEYNGRPDNPAEKLISDVFGSLEREADPVIARLHLENRLRHGAQPRHRGISTTIKVLAFLTALLVLVSWAGTRDFSPWDDGQLITFRAPADFQPSDYPHWMAIFANHSAELSEVGGHSLVVDYSQGDNGRYYFQLGVIGINYTEATSWVRDLLTDIPEIQDETFTVTQPLLPYRVSVNEMIAFNLFGDTYSEEQKVMDAWRAAGEQPRVIFLVAKTKDYQGKVSELIF